VKKTVLKGVRNVILIMRSPVVAKAKGSSVFGGLFCFFWFVGFFACLGCFVGFGFLFSFFFPAVSFFLVVGVLVYTSSVL
jgi:hypothetical protein